MRRIVALLGAVAAVVAARRLGEHLDAVEVRGRSMAPALQPGDRLLVESISFRRRRPRPGEIVLAPDPRAPERELIKRVASVNGTVVVVGDAPGSTDSRTFGPIDADDVRWRVALRYWPPRRVGRPREVRPAPPRDG